MPSNTTTNYQLNQWEPDDKVLRTDFNADNTKIDAAIKAVDAKADSLSGSKAEQSALTAEAKARADADAVLSGRVSTLEDRARLHTIKSITYSGSELFQMDVTDVEWSKWRQILLLVELDMSGPYVEIEAAEPSNSYTITSCNKNVTFPILLFPFYRDDIPVSGLSLGNNSEVGFLTQLTYQTITNFHMTAHYSGSVNAGSRMTLYGIK